MYFLFHIISIVKTTENTYNICKHQIEKNLAINDCGINISFFYSTKMNKILDEINDIFEIFKKKEIKLKGKIPEPVKKYFFSIPHCKIIPISLKESSSIFNIKIKNNNFILKRTYSQNEASLYKKFSHRNIVETYMVCERGSCLYKDIPRRIYWIFMEYLDTELKFPVNSIGNIREMFLDILNALKYIHEQGYVHNDIKPNNILVKIIKSKKGEKILLKLTDFGLTRKNNYISKSSKLFYGTFLYYSPESVLKKLHVFKNDSWGFGILLYYEFVDDRKYSIKDIKKCLNYYDQLNISSNLKKNIKNCSVELIDLIAKCLETDYEKRIDVFQILNHNFFHDYQTTVNSINK